MSAAAQEKAAANDAQNDVKGGKWVRKAAAFREQVTADGSSGFKAEAGRYVIVAAHGCPWSCALADGEGGHGRAEGRGAGANAQRQPGPSLRCTSRACRT